MRRQLSNQIGKTFWLQDVFFLTIFLIVLFFFQYQSRPLSIPDESNYADIVREMLTTHNYFTPYLNGIKFFEKPILLYWLGTFAIKLFGYGIDSLRMVNACLALLTCLLTYYTAQLFYSRFAAILSSVILATNILFFGLAHQFTTDMTVTAFLTSSLYFLLYGALRESDVFIILGGCSGGFAILAKGLIGIVFPFLIICTWTVILNKNYYSKKQLIYFILSCSVIALPWHLWMLLHHKDFWQIYFIAHHLQRFATHQVGHPQAYWYYVPVILVGFFPWIAFLPQALKSAAHSISTKNDLAPITLFWLVWIGCISIFFTLATSKLISYILPIFPPLAILLGNYIATHFRAKYLIQGVIFLCIINMVLSIVLTNSAQWLLAFDSINAYFWIWIMCAILNISALSAFCLIRNKRLNLAATVFLFMTFAYLFLALHALPYLDSRSTSFFAAKILKLQQPDDKIISLNHYYQDLGFYLKKNIYLTKPPKILLAGSKMDPQNHLILDNRALMDLWKNPQRLFILIPKNDFELFLKFHPKMYFSLISFSTTDILISNQKNKPLT
jgi:4-amino-4-deoxy-L-arabinose transferase-like glycosyltransferase